MKVQLIKQKDGSALLTIDAYTLEEKECLTIMGRHNVHVTSWGYSGPQIRLQILSNNIDDPAAGFFKDVS